MTRTSQPLLGRSLVVFPTIALVIAVGCSGASGVVENAETSAARTTTTVKAKSSTSSMPTALAMLQGIKVMRERPQGYSRALFTHWIDADGDGCNTREEVLIAESQTPAQVDAYGCKVIEGDWVSAYDGTAHSNPSELDIDHMIPLKEAWDSGAWAWSSSQRRAFANDLSDSRVLIAVTASQNRIKSDKDPSNWLPPRAAYVCAYLANWVAIKDHWHLSMDQSEFGRIKNVLTASCQDIKVASWGSSPTSSSLGTSPTPSGKGASPTTTTRATSGVRQVRPVRCAKADFGQMGQYKGIAYVCSNRRASGESYAPGYYFWRPA